MKYILIVLASFFQTMIYAQERMQNISTNEKFSLTPGIIYKSKILYDQGYYKFLVQPDQHVALVKYWGISQKDTIYVLKFYGQVYKGLSERPNIDIIKKYEVLIDPGELKSILTWLEMAIDNEKNGNAGAYEQIMYVPKDSRLLLKSYKDIFEIQYDNTDLNSVIQMKALHLHDLYNALLEIRACLKES